MPVPPPVLLPRARLFQKALRGVGVIVFHVPRHDAEGFKTWGSFSRAGHSFWFFISKSRFLNLALRRVAECMSPLQLWCPACSNRKRTSATARPVNQVNCTFFLCHFAVGLFAFVRWKGGTAVFLKSVCVPFRSHRLSITFKRPEKLFVEKFRACVPRGRANPVARSPRSLPRSIWKSFFALSTSLGKLVLSQARIADTWWVCRIKAGPVGLLLAVFLLVMLARRPVSLVPSLFCTQNLPWATRVWLSCSSPTTRCL